MVSSEDVLKRYGSEIERKFKSFDSSFSVGRGFSRSYERFKEAMVPEFTRYEKWCKAFGNFLTLRLSEKDRKKYQKAIKEAHLNITPSQAVVFSFSLLFITLFGGIFFLLGIWLLWDVFSLGAVFLIILFSFILFFYTLSIPQRMALKWRLKASSQLIPAVLYVVVYMKHTSNLEKAIAFAAEHLEEPLALDFRKIFWDVEVGRYATIRESLDAYLEDTWMGSAPEFVEAFHLIESSLYEPDNVRRIEVLERALQVVLDGVYDNMLKYTHNVKSPLTSIYMLGIVLPTLGLALLPLASTMLGGALKWYHVMIVFNVFVPLLVLYLTDKVLMMRPGGYGEASLLKKNPLYPKYKSNKGFIKGIFVAFPFFLLGIVPLLFRYTNLPSVLGVQRDYTWKQLGIGFLGNNGVFGIVKDGAGNLVGPTGVGALILSLFVPLSFAMVFYIAYKEKSKDLIVERDKTKKLEQEFTSSLFQLGNRLGDGIPAEIAFSKVRASTRGSATEGFFRLVDQNIHQLGMSLERALFDPKRGAVVFYPSQFVSMSMKILLESVKKGLRVAARALISISEYMKNIKKINDRLTDLLADVISDMRSNMTFLAPLLSGIIIGLAGMITLILSTLASMFAQGSEQMLGASSLQNLLAVFDVSKMIPPYWLQVVIGIYLIQIVFILTSTLVTIKSGRDELQTTYDVSRNLRSSFLLYFFIAFASIVGLTLIAVIALAGMSFG